MPQSPTLGPALSLFHCLAPLLRPLPAGFVRPLAILLWGKVVSANRIGSGWAGGNGPGASADVSIFPPASGG